MTSLPTNTRGRTGAGITRSVAKPWRRGGIVSGILLAFLLAMAVLAVLAPVLPLAPPSAQALDRVWLAPGADAWLGTDQYGRDLLSRVIWGIRTTLFSATIAVVVLSVVGIPLGLVGAYRQDWVGALLGRLSDTVLAVPGLVLLITVQAALRTDIYGQMVVLGLIFAPRMMRVVQNTTVSILNSPYLIAGRLSGCSQLRVLRQYVLPNAREQVIVQATFLFSLALIVEAGISYLGIGVRPPRASLGTLLDGGAANLAVAPRLVLIPAVILILLILAANIVGDTFASRRDADD